MTRGLIRVWSLLLSARGKTKIDISSIGMLGVKCNSIRTGTRTEESIKASNEGNILYETSSVQECYVLNQL